MLSTLQSLFHRSVLVIAGPMSTSLKALVPLFIVMPLVLGSILLILRLRLRIRRSQPGFDIVESAAAMDLGNSDGSGTVCSSGALDGAVTDEMAVSTISSRPEKPEIHKFVESNAAQKRNIAGRRGRKGLTCDTTAIYNTSNFAAANEPSGGLDPYDLSSLPMYGSSEAITRSPDGHAVWAVIRDWPINSESTTAVRIQPVDIETAVRMSFDDTPKSTFSNRAEQPSEAAKAAGSIPWIARATDH